MARIEPRFPGAMNFKVTWEVWVGNQKQDREIEFTTEEAATRFAEGLQKMKGMENVKIETNTV